MFPRAGGDLNLCPDSGNAQLSSNHDEIEITKINVWAVWGVPGSLDKTP